MRRNTPKPKPETASSDLHVINHTRRLLARPHSHPLLQTQPWTHRQHLLNPPWELYYPQLWRAAHLPQHNFL
ncbi:hypothetical protein XELAEV_18003364mg [Xenopus laevis]|uniref:Uncharacterized protein n=1 Tax=Xenopus laevis TaxID=8355 RepID=A0A974BN54_XENLA|nr:hypothetical protein XELAEV_18003364mg [Xenopus laevis]